MRSLFEGLLNRFWPEEGEVLEADDPASGEPAPVRVTTAEKLDKPQEQRRMPRVSLRVKAEVQWDGQRRSGMTANVSLSGARLVLPEPIPTGTPVAIVLELPNCPPVSLDAHVVTVHGDGIAIAFTVASQDRFVPYFFSYRHGTTATRLLTGDPIPPIVSSSFYLIGCPIRFTTSQLVSLVAPCGDVETATLTRLEEGAIATIAMASPSAAALAQQSYHQQLVGGSPLFIYLRGMLTAEILRIVLQQNALRRFA
ncbi:MAG TPA: PilZ domain-containing protein, partial [Nitrospirales bacterium]|nr:PilZ domain-containing protein [Nitrospirales bacterium]